MPKAMCTILENILDNEIEVAETVESDWFNNYRSFVFSWKKLVDRKVMEEK